MGRIVGLQEAARLARAAQGRGERVVLCHGCFDIVHPGHVRHLQQARRLGDRLLVTVTGDGLVNKDTGRPLIPQELRAENLAALDCVDWVAVNADPTAVDLLRRVRPDVYVKGREYETNRDPRFEAEKAVVEGYGGRLVFSSGDVVFSSTALIAALEQSAPSIHGRFRRLAARAGLDAGAVGRLLEGFRDRRVVVIGETLVDTYVTCDRPQVAGEGPLMTLRPVEERRFDGGAARVAAQLRALGARVVLVTAAPPCRETAALRRRLVRHGVEVRAVRCGGLPVEKRRFLVGATKLMKLDLGGPVVLDTAGRRRLVEVAQAAAADAEAAIVADYGEGLFTRASTEGLCRALRPLVDVLVGDARGRHSNLLAMRSMDLVCPSEPELREALHDYDDGLSAVVWRLLHETASKAALVSLGSEGTTVFGCPPGAELREDDWRSRLTAEHVPAAVPHQVDALGCGDALLAVATLALLARGSLTLAAIVGAAAAAAGSQRLGAAVLGAADLRRTLDRLLQARLTVGDETPVPLIEPGRDQLHPAHA